MAFPSETVTQWGRQSSESVILITEIMVVMKDNDMSA